MDPDTGKFYRETLEMAATNPFPQSWPRFQLGEHFDIGGVKMRLDRVYDNSIRMRMAGLVKGRREKRDRSAKRQPDMQKFHVGQTVTVGQVQMIIKSKGKDSLQLHPVISPKVILNEAVRKSILQSLNETMEQSALHSSANTQ